MNVSTYIVNGMTCGHCASSVTEQLTKIDGVQSVDVDLASGNVVVTSENPLAREDVTDAVTEAGYELVP